jgi:hypothetical protein
MAQSLDTAGGASMATGTILWIVDKLNLMTVNDVLTGVSLFVGVIWVCFKIRNEMMLYKINKRNYDNGSKK